MKIHILKSDGNGQLQLIERDDMEVEGCSFDAIEKLISQGINAGDIKKLQDAGIRNSFETIDKLIAQGINAGDIKKLQDAGLFNWNQFMMRAKKDFTGVTVLSGDKVEKICDTICEAKLKVAEEEILRITSGSSSLDEHSGVIAQRINAGDIKKLQDAGHTVSEAVESFAKKEILKITSGSSALDEHSGGNDSVKTQLAHTPCAAKQIFVKTLAGKTLCFNLKTDETISDLKRKIEEKEVFPVGQQKLIFAGKELMDSIKICDYKFYDEATVYLTSVLHGGSRKRGKDISKGQRNIFKAKDKQANEDASTARMQRLGPRIYCPGCATSPPFTTKTMEEMLEHQQELHPALYIETMRQLQEEADKRAKEKKEIEELVAQIVAAQGNSNNIDPNNKGEMGKDKM